MEKRDLFSYVILVLIIVFGITYSKLQIFNEPINNEKVPGKIRVSGAGKNIDLWSFERSYPSNDIQASKYELAFINSLENTSEQRQVNNQQWESLGPKNVAGRILSLAFHPSDEDIIYAGSASGGLWKSTSQGIGIAAWEYVSTGYPVHSVSSIVIDQNNPDIIYIGTGEVYGSGRAEPGTINRSTRGTYGIGILKSVDGGETWTRILEFDEDTLTGVNDLVISPLDSQIIYAATSVGVYKSQNSGLDWDLVFTRPNCFDIEIDPTNDNIIYVTQGNFNFNLVPDQSGIFKSIDGGNSFFELTHANLLSAWSGNAKISLEPGNPDVIYASIQVGWFNTGNTTPGGIFKSIDGGVNWSYINNQNIAQFQGWYSHDIAINPLNPDIIIYTGIDAWKSLDQAVSFQKESDWQSWTFGEIPIDVPEGLDDYVHGDIHAVYYHPINNKVFYATDGGVFVSDDGESPFTTLNGGLQTLQFYANMGSSSTDPNFCIAGAQDNGTFIYRGSDSWLRVIGGDGMSASVNQDDDNIVYGSFQTVNGLAKSVDGGEDFNTWSVIAPNINPGDFSAFLAPYELAPTDQDIIYAGTTYLYKSINAGDSWFRTTFNTVDGSNMIIKIAVSPFNSDIIFIATSPDPISGVSSAKLLKSTDGGLSFDQILGLPDRIVKDIEFDPTDDDTVYVVYSGFETNHVFKSNDQGNTWTSIDNGLPDLPTNTIFIDPLNNDNIYLGNDIGVYFSDNSGLSWVQLNDGLPDAVMVYDLNYSPANRKIRIATHGNGIYQRNFVNDALSLEEFNKDELIFQLYPNPAVEKVIVRLNNPFAIEEYEFEIYSVNGRKVDAINYTLLDKNTLLVDIKKLSSGTYFFRLKINDTAQVKSFIKR